MTLVYSHQWTGHSVDFLWHPIFSRLKPEWPRKWMHPQLDVCLGLMMYVSIRHCCHVQASEPYISTYPGVFCCTPVSVGPRGSVSESICMCFFVWVFECIGVFLCEQHLFDFRSNWGHVVLKLSIKDMEIISCFGASILPVVNNQNVMIILGPLVSCERKIKKCTRNIPIFREPGC